MTVETARLCCSDAALSASCARAAYALLPNGDRAPSLQRNRLSTFRLPASRHHLRAHRTAFPAREPFPVGPDIRLAAAISTNRDELTAPPFRFAARQRRAAAQSTRSLRLLRSIRFSPL